jgi:hypothetical protein
MGAPRVLRLLMLLSQCVAWYAQNLICTVSSLSISHSCWDGRYVAQGCRLGRGGP